VETLPAASVKPPRAPLVAAPLAAESPRIVEPPKIVEPLEIALEAEVPLPSWDDLESAATQPESFEPQEALDIMDETADEFGEFGDESSDESVAPTEGAGELSAGEEIAKDERRSRRRRRRRGRGRGREDAPSAEGQTSDVAGEESTSDQLASDQLASDEPASEELVVSESLEVDSDGATQEPVEESRSDEERSERRGRRRRRGRGRDRDQVRDEATSGEEIEIEDEDADFDGPEDDEAEEVVGAEAATEAGDEPDFDDVDGNDDDGDEEGGESPRIGFRNIPTWQDAIGVMIAKNMESRSRNPGGPRGSGGRGGRGRGRRPDRR
jgi:hypothetical protein